MNYSEKYILLGNITACEAAVDVVFHTGIRASTSLVIRHLGNLRHLRHPRVVEMLESTNNTHYVTWDLARSPITILFGT